MRKRLLVLMMAVMTLVMSATPALATTAPAVATNRPKSRSLFRRLAGISVRVTSQFRLVTPLLDEPTGFCTAVK
jgi:hypothetical protein